MVTAVIEKDDLLTEYSLILRKKDIIENRYGINI